MRQNRIKVACKSCVRRQECRLLLASPTYMIRKSCSVDQDEILVLVTRKEMQMKTDPSHHEEIKKTVRKDEFGFNCFSLTCACSL